MDLLQFIENVGGKALTEEQKELLENLREKVKGYDIVIVDSRYPPLRTSGLAESLLHIDYRTVEDRVVAHQLKSRSQYEKAVLLGTNYSLAWFDDLKGMQVKDIPLEQVLIGKVDTVRFVPHSDKPADHPLRKREPKGPRGKWGKFK